MKYLLISLLTFVISVGQSQNLLYSEYVPAKDRAEFEKAVIIAAEHLHVQPNWLMIVMAFETGRSFKPSVRNRYSGATGLIQFIPTTAKHLGTSTYRLSKMSRIQQLVYVEKYFAPYAGRMQDAYDVYLVVFAPAFLGRPNKTVLYRADSPTLLGKQRYHWNKVLDRNKDGEITIKDVKSQIKEYVGYEQDRRGIE